MSGLGPHGTSLRAKLGHPVGLAFPDPFAMQLEQQDRKEQRVAATVAWAGKNRTPAKPLAPVEARPKEKGCARDWTWMGETLKQFKSSGVYTSEELRQAGFKLPVLEKKPKRRKNESRD